MLSDQEKEKLRASRSPSPNGRDTGTTPRKNSPDRRGGGGKNNKVPLHCVVFLKTGKCDKKNCFPNLTQEKFDAAKAKLAAENERARSASPAPKKAAK